MPRTAQQAIDDIRGLVSATGLTPGFINLGDIRDIIADVQPPPSLTPPPMPGASVASIMAHLGRVIRHADDKLADHLHSVINMLPTAIVMAQPAEPAYAPLPNNLPLANIFNCIDHVAERSGKNTRGYLHALARMGREAAGNADPASDDFKLLIEHARDYASMLNDLSSPLTSHESPKNRRDLAIVHADLVAFIDRIAPKPPTLEELAAAVRKLLARSPGGARSLAPYEDAVEIETLLARVPK